MSLNFCTAYCPNNLNPVYLRKKTMAFSFETLTVWQKSRILVKEIYELSATFPENEKFGLTSQIRRAAISISSNIA